MGTSSERRDGPRLDLRLRVKYSSGDLSGVAEASDVSPRGLRLESETPVDIGLHLKMLLDAGDEDETLNGSGHVTWCRARKSHSGRDMYDIGVHFDHDWLAQDRGKLGSALARIFAMDSHEPARNFERTKVELNATSAGSELKLKVLDLSAGGMQIKAEGVSLKDSGVTDGAEVDIEINIGEPVYKMSGTIAWVSEREGDTCFGVGFGDVDRETEFTLMKLSKGEHIPTRISVTLR